jgi:plasmid stabilization system protein ParE
VSSIVLIRDAAQTDIREIHDWYEKQRPGLGDEFLVSIADALSRLESGPERLPIYYRGFRRVLTRRFPYRVFFRIEKDVVIVFRVLHVARDHTNQL